MVEKQSSQGLKKKRKGRKVSRNKKYNFRFFPQKEKSFIAIHKDFGKRTLILKEIFHYLHFMKNGEIVPKFR